MKVLIKLVRINYLVFIFIFFGLILFIGGCDYWLNLPEGATDNSVVDELEKYPIVLYFLVTVIFVPLIETVVFQGVVIELVRLKLKKKLRFCLSLSISSLLFGLSHFYNIYYVMFTVIMGFLFALAYYLTIYRKQSPILTVSLLHGMLNLAAFIEKFYL